MKYATSMEKLREVLKQKEISPYRLSKDTGINQSTMYSYVNQKQPMGAEVCAIIADTLSVPVTELFPEMEERDEGSFKAQEVSDDGRDHLGRKVRLTTDDMVVGAQSMAPEDGKTLYVRRVIAPDGVEYAGYTLMDNQQLIVRTGVSTRDLDLDKIRLRTHKDMVWKRHCLVLPFAEERDHELCVVVHSHGVKNLMSKGVPVAEIVFS